MGTEYADAADWASTYLIICIQRQGENTLREPRTFPSTQNVEVKKPEILIRMAISGIPLGISVSF